MKGALVFWVCPEGVWGVPPGGSVAPGWQIPGVRGVLGSFADSSDLARVRAALSWP